MNGFIIAALLAVAVLVAGLMGWTTTTTPIEYPRYEDVDPRESRPTAEQQLERRVADLEYAVSELEHPRPSLSDLLANTESRP